MRKFFLFLITSWLIGLCSAAWHVYPAAIAVVIAGLLITMRRLRQPLPLAVAALALGALGYVYASGTPPALAGCSVQPPVPASVVKTELLAASARYTVQTDNGCMILVSTARFPAWQPGDRLEITGKPPQPLTVLAQDNAGYAQYLARQGITAVWRFPSIKRVSAAPPAAQLIAPIAAHIGRLFREPDASVVHALVLANDSTLPEALEENFRITGLSHLLAISGSNISLLAATLVGLLYLLPLTPLTRTAVLAILLWIYMALIAWPVSAVRATFFWTFTLLALRLHLLMSLPNILLLTLVFMPSLDPQLTTDVSFQLSVSAVIGIFLVWFLFRRYLMHRSTLIKVLLAPLLVTAGATLMTLPVSMYHFGTVSLISIFANLLVAPVVGAQMVMALLTILLGVVLPSAALFPSYLVHLTVWWMEVVSSTLARLPGIYYEGVALPGYGVAMYYAVVAGAAIILLHYQGRTWREVWQ